METQVMHFPAVDTILIQISVIITMVKDMINLIYVAVARTQNSYEERKLCIEHEAQIL